MSSINAGLDKGDDKISTRLNGNEQHSNSSSLWFPLFRTALAQKFPDQGYNTPGLSKAFKMFHGNIQIQLPFSTCFWLVPVFFRWTLGLPLHMFVMGNTGGGGFPLPREHRLASLVANQWLFSKGNYLISVLPNFLIIWHKRSGNRQSIQSCFPVMIPWQIIIPMHNTFKKRRL